MVTWTARVAAFTIDEEPRPEEQVELLCKDHCGIYLLPFPCRRVGREWHNQTTGQESPERSSLDEFAPDGFTKETAKTTGKSERTISTQIKRLKELETKHGSGVDGAGRR